jgi:hypothetical protein
MPRKISEVNFFDFQEAVQNARQAGIRIDAADKQAFSRWVYDRRIPEGAMGVHAKSMSTGSPWRTVIISEGEWEGYYVYSTDEEWALRFDPRTD